MAGMEKYGSCDNEEYVNNELEALNLLEEGMTTEEKRNILEAIRLSESTAKEENKTRSTHKKSKIFEVRKQELELRIPLSGSTQKPSTSKTASPKNIFKDSTDSDLENDSGDSAERPNALDSLPVTPNAEKMRKRSRRRNRGMLAEESGGTVSVKPDYLRDKKMNIDVFFVDKESYQDTLRRRRRKINYRFPYDLLSKGVDAETLSSKFKSYHVNYAKKLEKHRNKSLNIVPWSKPIVGHTITLPSVSVSSGGATGTRSHTSQHYNLRDRQNTGIKFQMEIEDNSSDDDFFVQKRKTKKQNESVDTRSNVDCSKVQMNEKDITLDQTEKSQSVTESPKKTVKTTNDDDGNQNDNLLEKSRIVQETNSEKKCSQKSPQLVILEETETSKELYLLEKLQNTPPKEIKPSPCKSPDTQQNISSPVVSLKRLSLNLSDTPVKVSADGTLKEVILEKATVYGDEMKPSSGCSKKRRLDFSLKESMPSENEIKSLNGEKRICITLIDDKASEDEKDDQVQCPICTKMFVSGEIQEHASECIQFSEIGKNSSRKPKKYFKHHEG